MLTSVMDCGREEAIESPNWLKFELPDAVEDQFDERNDQST